jgi:hypothetical protein
VRLQQLSGRMIDAGNCDLISDFGLDQALLGGGKFGLRLQNEKNRARSQFVFALLSGHGFFA